MKLLSTAVDEFLSSYKVARRSENTIIGYQRDLRPLVALAGVIAGKTVSAFTESLVREFFKASEAQKLSIATLMRRRVAVRQFSLWGQRERLWHDHPGLSAPNYQRPKRLPKPFKIDERPRLEALELNLEDRTLRAVLIHTGCRVGEIVRITLGDITLDPRGAKGRIRVLGKGNKERDVPIHPDLDAALREYIHEYASAATTGDGPTLRVVRPAPPPSTYLFRRATGHPWTEHMIWERVKKWGQLADIVGRAHPHRFRHTFATQLCEQDVDVRKVQRLLGHASLDQTMVYTEIASDELERAILQGRPSTRRLSEEINRPESRRVQEG